MVRNTPVGGAHCPKNNLNLNQPDYHGWSEFNGIYPAFRHVYLAQLQDIFRCICFSRVMLGFYAEIHIIFRTVHGSGGGGGVLTTSKLCI